MLSNDFQVKDSATQTSAYYIKRIWLCEWFCIIAYYKAIHAKSGNTLLGLIKRLHDFKKVELLSGIAAWAKSTLETTHVIRET